MTRIAIVTEIPSPYRIPLFNALAAREHVDLQVLFLSELDPMHPYPVYADEFRFDFAVLRGTERVRGRRWAVLSRGAGGALRAFDPNAVVVGGWNQPAFWQAVGFARLRRRRALAWIESTKRDARPGSLPLEAAKRAFVRSCSGCVVPGSAAREYAVALGASPDRVFLAPNAVDETIFRLRVARERESREELRQRLGIEGCCFLFAGRLEPEKGIDILLEAMRDVAATAIVVGAGSQADALRRAAPPNVRFVGRLERDELPQWYAAVDAFVLPSRSEQWGLVLNEAANAGLPLVATEAAGGAWDLIEPGRNGFRVPTGQAVALAEALGALSSDEGLRARFGARSLELSRGFTPEEWADGILSAVRR